jgi:hypothetical protein
MAQGWIGYILGGREAMVAEPLSFVGDTLLRREAMDWAGREAVVVVGASLALALIGWLGGRLADPEPAVIAASLVLLAYVVHLLRKLPWISRLAWLAWRLGLPPRRLALLVVHRAVLAGMRRAECAVEDGLADAAWYVRGAAGLGKWWARAPQDKVAWRIAEATMPLLLRHALRTLALVLAPLLLVIATFRITVTYGLLLDSAAHLGVFEALVYPVAALVDALAGTSLRVLLNAG